MPPLVTLHPLVIPGVDPPLAPLPLLEVKVVSDLRLSDIDRDLLTLSVVCGHCTVATVICVIRRFCSLEKATLSTVFVDSAVVALLTGVSEAPELKLDDNKLCAFRAANFFELNNFWFIRVLNNACWIGVD